MRAADKVEAERIAEELVIAHKAGLRGWREVRLIASAVRLFQGALEAYPGVGTLPGKGLPAGSGEFDESL
jgi:hypothetical protein